MFPLFTCQHWVVCFFHLCPNSLVATGWQGWARGWVVSVTFPHHLECLNWVHVHALGDTNPGWPYMHIRLNCPPPFQGCVSLPPPPPLHLPVCHLWAQGAIFECEQGWLVQANAHSLSHAVRPSGWSDSQGKCKHKQTHRKVGKTVYSSAVCDNSNTGYL